MPVFSCANCGFRFEAASAKACPRCSSTEVKEFSSQREPAAGEKPVAGAPKHFGPMKSGKEGWKTFHNSDIVECPDCGGKDFDLNWKRREKTCRKCGAVLALPRRST